jgi:hypothetical protein
MIKRFAAAVFVAVIAVTAVGATTSAASARDTSWGCGGFC